MCIQGEKALQENDTEYNAAESLDIDLFTFRDVVEYYQIKGVI